MLPLLHNTLYVVLCPDKVILLSQSKGFSRDIQVQALLTCQLTEQVPAWRSALLVLESWLQENQRPRCKVKFVLSCLFVRYSLIPWSDEVQTEQEDHALAQAVFTDIYGDLFRDWTIAVVDTGYQQSKLAAAIDTELLKSIRRLCAVSRMALDSVEPWLTVAYSHFISQIEADSGLFAVEESGQLVTLAFQGKVLSSVRKDVVIGMEQLWDCLYRESVYPGSGVASPLYLYAQSAHHQPSSDTRLPIHFLRESAGCGYFHTALANHRQSLVLNFHPRRFSGSQSGWGLFAASLFFAICLTYFYAHFYIEHQEIQTEVTRMNAVKQQIQKQVDDPKMADTWKHAAGVIDQLSFPWSKLFFALESATVKDVALLAVQPDLQTGVITLSGEAKNWQAMVVYLRRLKEERFFTGVQLASHQIQQNDPQKPVRFVFLCEWGKISP